MMKTRLPLPTNEKRIRRWLLLTVFAAVGLRLLFCLVIYPELLADSSTVGHVYFFDSYREIATSVVTSGEYSLTPDGTPAIHRPPGYLPVLIAAALTSAPLT
jgi:hypothetical protein